MRHVVFAPFSIGLAALAGLCLVMAGAGPPDGKIYEKRCGGQLGRPDHICEYLLGFTALYEEETSNGWQTCVEPFSAVIDVFSPSDIGLGPHEIFMTWRSHSDGLRRWAMTQILEYRQAGDRDLNLVAAELARQHRR